MFKEKKDIKNQLVEIISKKVYLILVELIQEIGLDYVDIKREGFYPLRVMNNGDFKNNDKEEADNYRILFRFKDVNKGFDDDTIDVLRAQLKMFSEEIVNLRNLKKEIMDEIKQAKDMGAMSEEYCRELIVEKV